MANEDKKDFNAMLRRDSGMPKIQIVADPATIQKYGGARMYFAPPLAYDRAMREAPFGKLLTVGQIREALSHAAGADFTDPITAGIFVSIVAWASEQRREDKVPYWRTLKAHGELNAKYPGGIDRQKARLESEGHAVECRGRKNLRYYVRDYEKFLAPLEIPSSPLAPGEACAMASAEEEEIPELLFLLNGKDQTAAHQALQKLERISNLSPNVAAHWERFAKMLHASSGYARIRGFRLIVANARHLPPERLFSILDFLLERIDDEKPVVARQCIPLLPELARARPEFCERIRQALESATPQKYSDSMRPLVENDILLALAEMSNGSSAK